MTTIFYIVYSIWLGSEILISRLLRPTKQDRQGMDRNTLRIIWITVALACTTAVYIANTVAMPFIRGYGWEFRHAGLVVIMVGVVLRLATIRQLGKDFTVNVTIREGHRLKTDGMYTYLRHPSYTFSLVSFLGLGLTLNNWISLALIMVAMTTVFMMRIRVEEAALTEQFGQAYIEYKKKTYGLIPFIK